MVPMVIDWLGERALRGMSRYRLAGLETQAGAVGYCLWARIRGAVGLGIPGHQRGTHPFAMKAQWPAPWGPLVWRPPCTSQTRKREAGGPSLSTLPSPPARPLAGPREPPKRPRVPPERRAGALLPSSQRLEKGPWGLEGRLLKVRGLEGTPLEARGGLREPKRIL